MVVAMMIKREIKNYEIPGIPVSISIKNEDIGVEGAMIVFKDVESLRKIYPNADYFEIKEQDEVKE